VINTNCISVPAIDARSATTTSAATTAQVTLTASTSPATKKAHKGKVGSATVSPGVATSTATPKGAKWNHAGKEHHKHHAACNASLVAWNSTIAASNCTLTTSNSTLAASNITVAAETASNVTAAATTKTSTAEKKTGAKVAGTTKAEQTAQPSTNDLDSIIRELTGLDLGNVARDLATRETKGEGQYPFK
jgi:hypothetical protein